MKLYLTPLLFTLASAAVPTLTPETWDEMTTGKSVFIKYFAPWCGHCKAMAGDWEKLAEEYAGDDSTLIAEVDCTIGSNGPLCNGVKGYPTVKYGDPNDLSDYDGGRTYDALSAFARENLGPVCGPASLENCDEEEKELISKFSSMKASELEAAMAEIDQQIEVAEAEFEEEVDKLQQKYDELETAVEATKVSLKVKSGYIFMEKVLSTKADDEDEPTTGDEL